LADSDTEFQRLADRLWGDGNERDRVVGAGHVFSGITAAEALQELGVQPDWNYSNFTFQQADWLWLTHRSTDSVDIYYVVNRRNVRTTLPITLRATGKTVEAWDPVTGQTTPVTFTTTGGRTAITVDLGPVDSVFLVIAKGTPGSGPRPRRPPGRSAPSTAVGTSRSRPTAAPRPARILTSSSR
jgi:hypothetical protein